MDWLGKGFSTFRIWAKIMGFYGVCFKPAFAFEHNDIEQENGSDASNGKRCDYIKRGERHGSHLTQDS